MVCGFELTDIDWSNQDVGRIMEFCNKKFDVQDKEIARQRDELVQKDDIIVQLQDRVKQLEEEALRGKSRGSGSKKPRQYNTRQYKNYPH